MLRRAAIVVGGITLVCAGWAGMILVGMRTQDRRILGVVRRFNRDVTNKLQLSGPAGGPGAYAAIIRHRGRKSGREYATPVGAQPVDGGYLFALPYGLRTDWLQNVLAAGTATLMHEGQTVEVDSPELLTIEEANQYFEPSDQWMHRTFGVRNFLRLRRVSP
ncbi:nitroreductase family deazaflavin-dependent oxidoreductase [Georgenia alba]|uniref:Nitroreductase family deazaflavin-dependent oxidoreductase n=1 Tax=Georgenia alba TaxID=2233858 RepID=A0ABW2Q8W5_9MICO